MTMTLGTLYIIAAASGTGKTSLTKALVSSMPNTKISISHTTRPIKPGEKAGVNYFYLSEKEFRDMAKQNEFIEHAEVFGHNYGTSRSFITDQLQQGYDIILDIDWQGAQQIRAKIPDCITIFLLPPSKQVLRQRLEQRKRDEQNIIEQRLALASSEIAHYNEFDYLVINDDFETALRDLQAIVHTHKLKRTVQTVNQAALINELLS
jgi:guanylate kinase